MKNNYIIHECVCIEQSERSNFIVILDILRKNNVNTFLTFNDLKKKNTKINNITLKDKKNVKIVFLDDEGYDTELLKNLGYLDVHKMYKFTSLDDFEKYDIIFCDINGIGREIDEVYQGAAVAKKIKEAFPTKIVVILSAKEQLLTFNSYYEYVDDVMYKNEQISIITEKLDKYINMIINPIAFWENTSSQLIKQGVDLKEISKLEHYYVKSILEKKSYIKDINKISASDSLNFVSSIINGIVSAIELYLVLK